MKMFLPLFAAMMALGLFSCESTDADLRAEINQLRAELEAQQKAPAEFYIRVEMDTTNNEVTGFKSNSEAALAAASANAFQKCCVAKEVKAPAKTSKKKAVVREASKEGDSWRDAFFGLLNKPYPNINNKNILNGCCGEGTWFEESVETVTEETFDTTNSGRTPVFTPDDSPGLYFYHDEPSYRSVFRKDVGFIGSPFQEATFGNIGAQLDMGNTVIGAGLLLGHQRIPQQEMLTEENLDVMGGSHWRAGPYVRGEQWLNNKVSVEGLVGAWGLTRDKRVGYVGLNYEPWHWLKAGVGVTIGQDLTGPALRSNN